MSEAHAAVARNVTAMRAEPNDRGEQISQAILGETVIVKEDSGDYLRIGTPDGYSGWTRRADLAILETGERYPNPQRAALIVPLYQPVFRDASARSERITLLTLGTTVELGEGDSSAPFYPIRLPSGQTGFVEPSALIVPEYPASDRIGPNLILIGRGLIGVPYLWGGRTPFGFDCSGFVQRLFWLCGRIITRDAYQQAESPPFAPVEKTDLRPGDLVFFRSANNPRNRPVTHVGLAMGDGRFLHASGALGVATTPLDEPPYDREFVRAARFTG